MQALGVVTKHYVPLSGSLFTPAQLTYCSGAAIFY